MKKLLFLSIFLIGSILLAQNKILIIESYHSDYAWDKSYIEGIEGVLGNNYTVTKFQMDTKRVPKEKFQQKAEAYQGRLSPDCMAIDVVELWQAHESHRLDPKYTQCCRKK